MTKELETKLVLIGDVEVPIYPDLEQSRRWALDNAKLWCHLTDAQIEDVQKLLKKHLKFGKQYAGFFWEKIDGHRARTHNPECSVTSTLPDGTIIPAMIDGYCPGRIDGKIVKPATMGAMANLWDIGEDKPTENNSIFNIDPLPASEQVITSISFVQERTRIDDLIWLADQGCSFALPRGRTKGTDEKGKPTFSKGWQNNPRSLQEAKDHAAKNGNVGILLGIHSQNIIAIDRDVDFLETIDLLGGAAATAKIVRVNAPGRGKLLYRITGDYLPETKSWKPEGKTHPECEFLSTGRHALCPPSEYDGGEYTLIDAEYGIMEATPEQIGFIWEMITGVPLEGFAQEDQGEDDPEPVQPTTSSADSKDYVTKVKEAWPTKRIFEHFHFDTNGTKKAGKDTRLLGHGGLLLKDQKWYIHTDSAGGGPLEAWAYCRWGIKTKPGQRVSGKVFWDVINDMAQVAGIPRPIIASPSTVKPKIHKNGNGSNGSSHHEPEFDEDVDQGFEGDYNEQDAPEGKHKTKDAYEILKALEAIASNDDMSDQGKREAVYELSGDIADLPATEQGKVRDALVQLKLFKKSAAKDFITDVKRDKKERDKEEHEAQLEAARLARANRAQEAWPYGVNDGRIIFMRDVMVKGIPQTVAETVANFTAYIAEESTDESNNRVFVIRGKPVRGAPFTLDVIANEFGEPSRLASHLEAAAGALDSIAAGMAKHIGPAIKALTDAVEIKRTKRYDRTGWTDGIFLIHGREKPGISLDERMNPKYSVDPTISETDGRQALENMLDAFNGGQGVVLTSYILLAPMAAVAHLDDERFILNVYGLTGSMKTTRTQLAMGIWGKDFARDQNLIKFGSTGATKTAILNAAVRANGMPLILDNYKPIFDPKGELLEIVHGIVEGGDKRRSTTQLTARESRPIATLPILTGEAVERKEASSLARMLLMRFTEADENEMLPKITRAQETAHNLSYVGNTWLDYLETPEGKLAAAKAHDRLIAERSYYLKQIRKANPMAANPHRIASNLAVLKLAFDLACECPGFGSNLKERSDLFNQEMEKIVGAMATNAGDAVECVRLIATIRSMITSGYAKIVQTREDEYTAIRDHKPIIGRMPNSGPGVYIDLIPAITAAKAYSGDSFGLLSHTDLTEQMDAKGWIASKTAPYRTKRVKIDGKAIYMLHLTDKALSDDPDDTVTDESYK